jgi:ABC-type glycerol-3-phosphate transport system substrate-binding protein
MSKFQTILLGMFVVFAVGGLIIFSVYKGGQTNDTPVVVIWGTIDRIEINEYITNALKANGLKMDIRYAQKRPERIYQEYLEAVAARKAPNALLLSQDQILKFRGKIQPIPYNYLSQKDFKSTYIQQSELYLEPIGFDAFPFTVDPMVMYWNRDIFTNGGVANPPKRWNEFANLVPLLTKRDAATNITQSTVALGESRNIAHAKEIMSLLVLQVGIPITTDIGNQGLQSVLTSNPNSLVNPPALGALRFYTEFANPVKEVYSWNKSLQPSQVMFLSNKLAVYFGFASENKEIAQKNPNLNFGVTTVPQPAPQPGLVNTTFGKMYGFSLTSTSPNPENTISVLTMLTNKTSLALWQKESGLPSVRRDSLGVQASDGDAYTFSISSLWSRGWLDPDYQATQVIFADMIENVTTSKLESDAALNDAHRKIQNLLGK